MSIEIRCTDSFCCFLVIQALLTLHMKQDKLHAAHSDESCICIPYFSIFLHDPYPVMCQTSTCRRTFYSGLVMRLQHAYTQPIKVAGKGVS